MTQEEKRLLLTDLCARLPYGVFIHYHWSREGNTIDEDRELDFSDVETLKYDIENPQNDWCEISWKPYLRPMSSMTEEEKKEFKGTFNGFFQYFNRGVISDSRVWDKNEAVFVGELSCSRLIDWLNTHHFDYRGLIKNGLALEATDDMYEI